MPTILLVEDNELNRDMLSRRLEREGFTIANAVYGQVPARPCDPVLMDMSLPVLDGWEVTRRIRVRLSSEPGSVQCAIPDEGPGLSTEDQKKRFSKFARLSAKPTGGEQSTGLGLPIVKRMVEAMSGTVWCESEPGRGANFMVQFPAAPLVPEL